MATATGSALKNVDPLVRTYLDNSDWHFVSAGLLPRAAMILQSVIDQARDRGLRVTRSAALADNAHTRAKHDRTPFWIETDVESYRVQIFEISLPGGSKRHVGYGKHPLWLESRARTFLPSGRLELKITGFDKWSGTKFRDAKSVRVESRLMEVFDLISATDAKRVALNARLEEMRVEYARFSSLERVAKKLDSKVLGGTTAWFRAEEIRRFAEALASIEANSEWVERCKAVADVLDPLSDTMSVPTTLLPSESDLDAWLPKIK